MSSETLLICGKEKGHAGCPFSSHLALLRLRLRFLGFVE